MICSLYSTHTYPLIDYLLYPRILCLLYSTHDELLVNCATNQQIAMALCRIGRGFHDDSSPYYLKCSPVMQLEIANIFFLGTRVGAVLGQISLGSLARNFFH